MGFLKSKSALMIFDRHANLKYKYGKRNFWAREYYVDTLGRNQKVIEGIYKKPVRRRLYVRPNIIKLVY